MNEILKMLNELSADDLDSLITRANIMLDKKRKEEAEQARLEQERQRQEKLEQEKQRQQEIAELQRRLQELQGQAYVEPAADAWLSDSACGYLSYLMLEDAKGHDAFLEAVNRDWVSKLQMTVPGGLNVSSDAALFNANEYDVIVRTRGAVVFHELREAMGRDALLAGLAGFFHMGEDGRTLTEMDLVTALDAATGGDWEAFLTEWLFNVGEYVNQTIDWYE